jgi:hypothetical protein
MLLKQQNDYQHLASVTLVQDVLDKIGSNVKVEFTNLELPDTIKVGKKSYQEVCEDL